MFLMLVTLMYICVGAEFLSEKVV